MNRDDLAKELADRDCALLDALDFQVGAVATVVGQYAGDWPEPVRIAGIEKYRSGKLNITITDLNGNCPTDGFGVDELSVRSRATLRTPDEADCDEAYHAADERLCFGSCTTHEVFNAGWNARAALSASRPAGEGWTDAARDVLAERARQLTDENWSLQHDDAYEFNELARAAACYTLGQQIEFSILVGESLPAAVRPVWPWDQEWWKPGADSRRRLVKAGALILAEIERLDRKALPEPPRSHAEDSSE